MPQILVESPPIEGIIGRFYEGEASTGWGAAL